MFIFRFLVADVLRDDVFITNYVLLAKKNLAYNVTVNDIRLVGIYSINMPFVAFVNYLMFDSVNKSVIRTSLGAWLDVLIIAEMIACCRSCSC